ncbi:hypothetical protein CUZ94_2003 [Enterococcus faecium]|nr:hypothetical protein [Enterococcus faecium]MBK4853429.1 hypothetical protein [Enterococcus faecium]MBK4863331.1 hypothetical protein [Enterococcus faecium]MBK4878453.1 hypothetical protein [Enterococcus faecium]
MNWHEVAEGVMIIFGKLSSKLLFSKLNDCGLSTVIGTSS